MAEGLSADGPYRVVELATVTDEAIQDLLNEWTGKGYQLDAIHFAMRESSRRPAMAFLVFTRPEDARTNTKP